MFQVISLVDGRPIEVEVDGKGKEVFRFGSFSCAKIEGREFSRSSFENCSFSESSWRGAVFDQSHFWKCDLSGATFIGCSFRDTRFTRCNLMDVHFIDCDLRHIHVANSCIDQLTLTHCRGLDNRIALESLYIHNSFGEVFEQTQGGTVRDIFSCEG